MVKSLNILNIFIPELIHLNSFRKPKSSEGSFNSIHLIMLFQFMLKFFGGRLNLICHYF